MRVRWSEKQDFWKAHHPQREGEKETSGVKEMHRVNLNTPDFYLQKAWCNLQDQTQYKKKKEEKKRHSLKKHLTFMHCGMFKVTHPSSLPGRKRHTQLGIVWKGACHLASLRLSHTHMHTYNNGRLGFVFPWQSVPAIFPRWQRNMALKCCTVCVCVCVCVCARLRVYRELSCPLKSPDVQTLTGLLPLLTLRFLPSSLLSLKHRFKNVGELHATSKRTANSASCF